MKTKNAAFAGIFTLAVLLTGFFIGSMFPFDEGTVSWCDMNQQGIPLLCDFKDILEGNDGMFLNLQNAFGMNFYGIFFFFLASPFSFLCVFVDKVDIPFLINIIVVLKLTLSAVTASLYFSKRFKNLSLIENGALSAAYGLCGFGMLFFQNIMWLDIMYMLPLLMLGIYKLIYEGKPLIYIISLTITLIMNYYISYMVILFVILYFGILTARRIIVENTVYVDLGISTLSSLLMSAVVILPCFLQYTQSARQKDIILGLMSADFFGHTYTTVPVILCTAIIFAVLIFIMPRLHLQNNIFKGELIVFLMLLVPLIIEPINMMWHTGNYMSFPARFAFITIFVGLCLVANWIENREKHENNTLHGVIISVGTVVVCFYVMLWYTTRNIHILSEYVKTLWGDRESLRSLLVLFLFALIAYFAILYLHKNNKIGKTVVSLLLCVLVFAEGLCAVKIYMNSAAGKFNYYNYREFMKLYETADDSQIYRVNIDNKFIDANMTGAAGFNSVGHYTSLNNTDTMTAAKQLGYSGYWMETGNWGGSVLSDALMSVKYTAVVDNGEYVLIENPYYLGMGIKTNAELPKTIPERERIEEVGKLFAQITGTNNSVIKYMPTQTSDCYIDTVENGQYKYYVSKMLDSANITYKINITEPQRLYFDCYNGFSINLTETINNSMSIFVDGVLFTPKYPTQRENGLLDLGRYEDCELEIKVMVYENIEATSFGLWGVREQQVEEAVNSCETLDLAQDGGTLKGTVKTAGNYFFSIPYSDNLKITLNGEAVEYSKALTGFVNVKLENGGELEISATPKGFWIGFAASLAGVLLTVLYLMRLRIKVIANLKISRVLHTGFYAVFVLMILVIYILPVCINLFA